MRLVSQKEVWKCWDLSQKKNSHSYDYSFVPHLLFNLRLVTKKMRLVTQKKMSKTVGGDVVPPYINYYRLYTDLQYFLDSASNVGIYFSCRLGQLGQLDPTVRALIVQGPEPSNGGNLRIVFITDQFGPVSTSNRHNYDILIGFHSFKHALRPNWRNFRPPRLGPKIMITFFLIFPFIIMLAVIMMTPKAAGYVWGCRFHPPCDA